MNHKLHCVSQTFTKLLQLWFLDLNPSESRKRPTAWFLASQLMPILLVQAPDTENWILGHKPDGTQGQKAPGHHPVPIPGLPLHHPLKRMFSPSHLCRCQPHTCWYPQIHQHSDKEITGFFESQDITPSLLPPTPFFAQVFPWSILSSPSSFFPL